MRRSYLPFFILSIALLASCSDDDEGDGTSCVADDFAGVWNMDEQCGGSDFQYPLTIEKTGTGLLLTNLGGLGVNSVATATVDGATFTIPPQTVQGVTFSGNGSLNAGCAQLTVNWQGGLNGTCGSTGTK